MHISFLHLQIRTQIQFQQNLDVKLPISLYVCTYMYIYNMYSLLKPMIVYSMILHQKHVPLSHRSYSILNGCIALYAPMSYIILWDEFAMSCCWVMYATLDITR